jgi:hypothetical protein
VEYFPIRLYHMLVDLDMNRQYHRHQIHHLLRYQMAKLHHHLHLRQSLDLNQKLIVFLMFRKNLDLQILILLHQNL